MHKHPQNQSYLGSSGQTLTTNASMTLYDSQIRHQTHVLCGCTTFGTESKLGPKLIRSLRLLYLGQGRSLYKAGGGGYFCATNRPLPNPKRHLNSIVPMHLDALEGLPAFDHRDRHCGHQTFEARGGHTRRSQTCSVYHALKLLLLLSG